MRKRSIKKNNAIKSIIIIVVTLLLAVFVYPQGYKYFTGQDLPQQINKPFKLGLDLQGGTHLVYQADMSDVPAGKDTEAIEGVRDVIERRVNAFGVSEPLVQATKVKNTWRLIVELAGVTDVNEAINLIGQTPLLEFKEENNEPPRDLTLEELDKMNRDNEEFFLKARGYLDRIRGDINEFDKIEKEITPSSDISVDEEGNAVLDFQGLLDQEEKVEDLGFITPEGLYGEIAEQAVNYQKGEVINNVVDSPDGYNVVRVDDFRDSIKARHILICYQGAQGCTNDTSKEDARKKIEELKQQATPENFEQLAKDNSTEPGSDVSGGNLGWFSKEVMVKPFADAAFALEKGQISDVVETQFGFHIIYKEDIRQDPSVTRIVVNKITPEDIVPPQSKWKNTELSGKHLKRAVVDFDQTTGLPIINLEFNDEGKDLFAAVTERNVGKGLAIFLDGASIIDTNNDGKIDDADEYAPTVQNAIKSGNAQITGLANLETAKQITKRLTSGALPVPISLINQQTIGATLGAQSVAVSLKAGILGIIVVMLFMLLYYRLPGVTAVLSLVLYTGIILTLFKLIPVTLTLSGIAGFILSIGMAVDANVLIFERIKEEMGNGKPIYSAINDGYKRAWTSIRDGNVSTLITCIILGWFGTSIIKGFAITLGIGVLISMFSAIIITRVYLYAFSPEKLDKYKWLFLIKK